jgi:HK97 family phage prohead protease
VSSPFDAILAGMQQIPIIDPTDDITDPEQAKQALLSSMFPTQYQEPPRYTTPIYESPDSKTAPDGSPWKEQAVPFPSEFKDVNQRKGELTAYLTVWNDPNTNKPFIDSYKDILHTGSFDQTVKELEQTRKYKNTEYLVPDLWQHDRREQIGGIKAITKDSKGIIYVAQLVRSIYRARHTLDLAEQKMIGSSFGYDPVIFDYSGDIRNLRAVKLHEISQVTFPANEYAPILDVKSRFYVPALPQKQVSPVDRVAISTGLNTAAGLFDQLTNHLIKAYQQYKTEAEWQSPRFRR